MYVIRMHMRRRIHAYEEEDTCGGILPYVCNTCAYIYIYICIHVCVCLCVKGDF